MSTPGPPAGTNLLELVPVRTAGWSEDAGRVVLEVPAPSRPWRAPIAWLSSKASSKRLRLDDVGSFAWTRLDGRRTVGEVAAVLRERFGDRVEPAEERLGALLSSLHRGGLVGYAGYDEIPGPYDPR
ncbi:MAG: PqqD family protein [Thermoanaerobaculia bacterium]